MPYTYDYPRPTVTADAVVFRTNSRQVQVLLIKRKNEPFKGMWAIPGGFIEMDEELEDSARRELEEETGLTGIELMQFGVYGKVNRDPRHRTVTIAYAGFIGDKEMEAHASDDADDSEWFNLNDIPEMAFDHNVIIDDAIKFATDTGWFKWPQ